MDEERPREIRRAQPAAYKWTDWSSTYWEASYADAASYTWHTSGWRNKQWRHGSGNDDQQEWEADRRRPNRHELDDQTGEKQDNDDTLETTGAWTGHRDWTEGGYEEGGSPPAGTRGWTSSAKADDPPIPKEEVEMDGTMTGGSSEAATTRLKKREMLVPRGTRGREKANPVSKRRLYK